MKIILLISMLMLTGCYVGNNVTEPGPIVETSQGEKPVVCYVYARHRKMLVPVSCATAEDIE